jgi:diguanylate cyclase (GGDEF)-like protein/PAS domain S-box-containing protein
MTSDFPIERIAQTDILACSPDVPVCEAARRMHEARCSSILVLDRGKAVGIWTERDALSIDFSDPRSLDTPISAAMSSPVRTIHRKTSVGEASMRFREEKVRHFLVVDDEGDHHGIVTQTDVVHSQGIEYYVLLREVRSVLSREPVVVPGELPLGSVAEKMRRLEVDAVVVQGDGGILGILTERDMIRLISGQQFRSTAWDMASKPLVAVSGSSSLYHARGIFAEKRIRHLGVTDDRGELLGLITYGDILESIEYAYIHDLQKALRQRDESLNASNHRLRLAEKVFETTYEGIMVTDADSVIESVNPAFSDITGYDAHEVIGQRPSVLSSGRHGAEFYRDMFAALAQRGGWQGEVWNRRKNGEVYAEWLSISAVRDKDGQITNYVAIFSDITERKASEEHVRHLAHHDALTGLPNRILLTERLEHALPHANRAGTLVAVMFLDLDRFKLVNDTLGHSVGDELLKAVAKRLTSCVREDDTVARLGGDEFVLVLEDVRGSQDIAKVAEKIIDSLSKPLMLDQHEIVVTPSVGISVYPHDGDDVETLVKHADVAMYRAKEKGRNNYQFFTADMNARAFERLTMENSLRKALERNEFVLYYQPQVDLESHRITGMEALLRWQHPDFGLVSPTQFIPIAEETGLIVAIGEWVLRTACAQNKAWQDAGIAPLRVAVNLSARQFKQANLVEMVRRALDDAGLEARYLELEITETVAMDHAEETAAKLRELKSMGVGISMDDFGTGHSSLSYLKRFPIDTLKIDQTFIQDIAQDSSDAAIASAITAMAHSLNLKVVTEGIETKEQLAFLGQHGRDEVQGYYFSEPLPAEAFAELLKQERPFDRRA